MDKWVCSICGHVYDPAEESQPGEVTGAAKCGIADEKGELPDNLTCQQCGAMKEAFHKHSD